MKKCPYNRKKLIQIIQQVNDLASEETGVVKSHKQALTEEYELMECLGENCGVYYSGKCNYQVVQVSD